MKYLPIITITLFLLFSCNNKKQAKNDIKPVNIENIVRVGTFNVGVGQFATAQEIGAKLKPLQLDILSLQECPILINKDTDAEEFYSIISKELGMEHHYIGAMSSGNHWVDWGVDKTGKYAGKYKVILSKTPIKKSEEIALSGTGWVNSSVIRIETKVQNKDFSVYSLHIPGSNGEVKGSVMEDLVNNVLSKEVNKRVIILGDFNDLPKSSAMQYIFSAGYKSVWDDIKNPEQFMDKYTYGAIDNILLSKNSDLDAKIAYSVFPETNNLSDHPYIWSEITVKE